MKKARRRDTPPGLLNSCCRLSQNTPSTIAPTKAKATYAATTLNLLAMVMATLPDEFAAHITPQTLTGELAAKKSASLSLADSAAHATWLKPRENNALMSP